jgi:hypothetical protein
VLAIAHHFRHSPVCLSSRRETYVDVLGQELVRDAVLVDDIVVHAGASCGRACEKSEEAKKCQ